MWWSVYLVLAEEDAVAAVTFAYNVSELSMKAEASLAFGPNKSWQPIYDLL